MAGPAAFAVGHDAGERLAFGDVTILGRASGAATGGACSGCGAVPRLVDTPLHVHEREDELFYVLEGEHVYQVGDEEFRIGPGGVAFGPRGVPHAQRRVVPGEGRMLELTTPGGFDGFFRALADAERIENGTMDAYLNAECVSRPTTTAASPSAERGCERWRDT